MRTAFFCAGLFLIACGCSPSEKLAESLRSASFTPVDQPLSGGDSLYRIIERNGYGAPDAHRVSVNVLTKHLVDVSRPGVETNYVAAVIVLDHRVSLAVFDAARNMKFVSLTTPEFPDTFTLYDNTGEHPSGQGPSFFTSVIRLSDAGDVMAVTVKSGNQYIGGTDEDEDVWLFALWQNEIVMLMGYSRRFHHLVNGSEGWSENIWSAKEFVIGKKKTKGMLDVTLKVHQKVVSDTHGRGGETDLTERFIFNGKEYLQE